MNDQPKRRVLAYFDSIGKIVAGLTGVVLLISAIVSLIYSLWPNTKPSNQPSTVFARINEITSHGTTSLSQYLLLNEESTIDHPPGQLREVGHYYELKLTLRGLHEKELVLVWSLYDAAKDSPIVRPHWINQEATTVRAVADAANQLARVWIQEPTFRGRFYALIEIDDGKNRLDSEPTELFTGLPARVAPTVRPRSVISVSLAPRTKTSGCKRGSLPDRGCSPGAYYSHLTKKVICSPSFSTRSVNFVPESVRRAVEAEYGFSPGHHGASLHVDHIIPLLLGGSNDIANLFAETASPRPGYREKDVVEIALPALVCEGKMTLAAARTAIATDWVVVYNTIK